MLIYPTIYIEGGFCAWPAASSGANDDAAVPTAGELAARMAGQGFAWIHLVDRDARDHGGGANAQAIGGVLDHLDLPVMLDNGCESIAGADIWLDSGVNRLICAESLAADPVTLAQAAARHPGQLVPVIHVADRDAQEQLTAMCEMALAGVMLRDNGVNHWSAARALSHRAMQAGLHCIYNAEFGDFQSFYALLTDTEHDCDGVVAGRLYYQPGFDARKALGAVAQGEALRF